MPVVDTGHVCDLLPSRRKVRVCLEWLLTPDIWWTNTHTHLDGLLISREKKHNSEAIYTLLLLINAWKTHLCDCTQISKIYFSSNWSNWPLLLDGNHPTLTYWTIWTADCDYQHVLQLLFNSRVFQQKTTEWNLLRTVVALVPHIHTHLKHFLTIPFTQANNNSWLYTRAQDFLSRVEQIYIHIYIYIWVYSTWRKWGYFIILWLY